MQRIKPNEWAQAAVDNLGWMGAFLLARDYKRPYFGENPDTVVNQHSTFYRNAYAWIRTRLPATVTNDLASRGIKP